MLKRKKKIIKVTIGICAVVLVVLLVLCVIFRWYLYMPFLFHNGKVTDPYDRAIDMLNNKVPTEIFVYGEELDFRKTVQYKQIDSLSEESIKTDKEYTVCIVSDWNGNVTLTKEDVAFIKEQIKNLNFYFYYIGNDKLDMLKKEGIFDKNSYDETDRCTGIVTYEGKRTDCSGIYPIDIHEKIVKATKKGNVEEFLLDSVVSCYKSNN